jgi:hypothetical protein
MKERYNKERNSIRKTYERRDENLVEQCGRQNYPLENYP